MSVAEMLVAMAIVSLVGSGVFMAISLGSSRYAESMRMSESEELFATLETSLTHELRYTTSVVLANQGGVYHIELETMIHQVTHHEPVFLNDIYICDQTHKIQF